MIPLLIALTMTVLDVTLVNVALPVMAVQMHITPAQSILIVTVYQLIITMLLLPVSSAGDRYGYKKVFIIGLAVFTAASLLCALATGFTQLVIARALQGIGAACIMGVNIAITRIIYPRSQIGRGLALNAMVIAVTTAAGPSVAGAVLAVASWQWLFIINVPLGLAALIPAARHLPQNPDQRHSDTHFDYIGAVQNAIVFGLVFMALTGFSAHAQPLIPTAMLIAGIVAGYFYVRRQRTLAEPLLPVDLLRVKLYSMSLFTSVCSFIAQSLVLIALPFLFLDTFGYSTVTTGLLLTPWPIATMLISPIAARIIEHYNPGKTAAVGMAVFVVGIALLFLTANGTPSEIDIAWRMAVCGIGYGLYQTPNNVVMVIATPVHRAGGAGGLQSTARLVGQTTGAVLTAILFGIFCNQQTEIKACFVVAAIFGATACIFSLYRTSYMHRDNK